MREILFRAKCKHSGKWMYGSLIFDIRYTDKKEVPYIREKGLSEAESYFYGGAGLEVIPETVGQYTGLIDKNGTKIFEGDIVKRVEWGDEIFCVEFYEGAFGHKISKDIMSSFSDSEHGAFGEWFEVIGNKFDSPELLEAQDER